MVVVELAIVVYFCRKIRWEHDHERFPPTEKKDIMYPLTGKQQMERHVFDLSSKRQGLKLRCAWRRG